MRQLIGICAGVGLVVLAYEIFTKRTSLAATKSRPRPRSPGKRWPNCLSTGFSALPPHAPVAVAIAAAVGIILPILRRIERIKPYVPSGLAMGIAFIVPAFNSLVMFYGLVIWLIWKWLWPASAEKYTFAVASGMIAGEGLIGIVNAGLTIAGVEPLFPLH